MTQEEPSLHEHCALETDLPPDNNGDLCISGIDFIALSLKGTLEQVRGTDIVTTLKRFSSYSVQFTFICIAL